MAIPTLSEAETAIRILINNTEFDDLLDDSVLNEGFDLGPQVSDDFAAERRLSLETTGDKIRKCMRLIIRSGYPIEYYKELKINDLKFVFDTLPSPYNLNYIRMCFFEEGDYQIMLAFFSRPKDRKSTLPYVVQAYDKNRAETTHLILHHTSRATTADSMIKLLKLVDWNAIQRLSEHSGYDESTAIAIVLQFGIRKHFKDFIAKHRVGTYGPTVDTFKWLYGKHVGNRNDSGNDQD